MFKKDNFLNYAVITTKKVAMLLFLIYQANQI